MGEWCARCLLNKKLNAVPPGAAPETVAAYQDRVRDAVKHGGHMSSPEVLYEIDRAYAEVFGQTKDFTEIKRYFNALMLEQESRMAADVAAAPNPLERAMQYAMTGNFIDFAAMADVDEAELRRRLDAAAAVRIDSAMLARFRAEVGAARRMVYMTDNCGEIVADKVLIRELLRLNPELAITVMVRGAPVSNDATMDDARQVGLDALVSRVIDSGCPLAGNAPDRLGEEARAAMAAADLVLAKGQANFESMSDCGGNVYYAFMCKCDLFMNRFGVERFSGILTREGEHGVG